MKEFKLIRLNETNISITEDVLKRETSKRLAIECQFTIHTRATWMRSAF